MNNDIPRISIGLAVYNGAEFIDQAIQSILNQTYKNFELIISDNASTDETQEICMRYSGMDDRIRYFRNSTNIGGANNENLTFRLARGEFFRWAAHDDVCGPELLEKCINILDKDPGVVLCYTAITNINEKGEVLSVASQQKGTSEIIHQRFLELSKNDHNCEATYGLIRSQVLGKTRLQQNYTDSDRTLLCELSLHGKFYEIPDPIFFKRYHPKNTYVNMRARMAWFKPSLKGKVSFPFWMQLFDYLVTIYRVPISKKEKLQCYFIMLGWFFRHIKNLIGDLMFALISKLLPAKDPYAWRNKDKNLYNWE